MANFTARYPGQGGGGGGGVTSLNGEVGDITLTAGTGIAITTPTSSTIQIASTSAGDVTIGAFGSTPNANGLSISGSQVLNMQPADATHPGGISITTQTIAGDKTIQGVLTLTQPVASGNVSMLVFGNNVNTTPAIQWTSDNAQNGLLFYRDSTSNLEAQLTHTGVWKSHGIQAFEGAYLLNNLGVFTLTHDNSDAASVMMTIKGSVSQAGDFIEFKDSTGVITYAKIDAAGNITGNNLSGTNTGDVTIGTANGLSVTGQALSLALASTSTTGALSNTDWNTFNGKQAAGNYITALTGGVTASGPGSAVATVVTNANLTGVITSVGNATSIASQTGTGTKFVVDTSPTLVTPVIGAATGTSLSVSGQLTSTVATGTAPLVVSSTTQVANLNAATAGSATTATTATNLAGGAGGSIPYQSAAATTAMLANGSAGQYLKSAGGTSAPAWTTFTQPTQQILISGTTYTTPAGCKAIRIRLVGGGGGGGGAATAGGAAGAAGGGGGGGYVEHFITSPSANYTYAIGAGGAQGSAGNNGGAAGGDTTFGGVLTGSAGGGGAGSGAAASPVAKAGGDGGLATGGNILNIPGGQGSPGLICSATEATAGNGGATPFGMPAKGYTGVSHAGVAGNTNGGGGGSGGIQVNNGGNVTGGNGAAGQIVVDEYYE